MLWLLTYLKSRYPNFHTVIEGRLYRSATPKPADLEKWQREHAIKTWVDLRMPKDYIDEPSFFAAQCAKAKELGIQRISLPLDDFGVVSDEQVRVAMEILLDTSKSPTLVCCRGARHRAGLLCCLFRMKVQGWSAEKAFAEANSCGYYRHGHETFDKRFRQLLGFLVVLLMAVPAFGQAKHPFLRPDQATAAVVKESLTTEPVIKRFDRSFWIATSLYASAVGADFYTTDKAIERGGREGNPLFAVDGGRRVRYAANALASAGIWGIAAYLEKRGHRRFARVLLYTGAAIRTGAAIWNHSRRR